MAIKSTPFKFFISHLRLVCLFVMDCFLNSYLYNPPHCMSIVIVSHPVTGKVIECFPDAIINPQQAAEN